MSCVENNNWHLFWANNTKRLSKEQLVPYVKNFSVMEQILRRRYSTDRWASGPKSVLEVGAGRGTVSDMFKIRGCHTTCTDIFPFGHDVVSKTSEKHRYLIHDIIEDEPLDEKFDIIVTYGLLEHFKTSDKITIIRNVNRMLNDTGIAIHYVVPRKWTNRHESRFVYRDNCKDITSIDYRVCNESGIIYVYPYWGFSDWICGKFISKGFILWGGVV